MQSKVERLETTFRSKHGPHGQQQNHNHQGNHCHHYRHLLSTLYEDKRPTN